MSNTRGFGATAAYATNNRNLNAIRAILNGPNMSPRNWYKYASSLGYNTNRYANSAQSALNKQNLALLAAIITNSLSKFNPNNSKSNKNRAIRQLLTRNMKKSLSELPAPAIRSYVPLTGARGTTIPVIKNSPNGRWRIDVNAMRNRNMKIKSNTLSITNVNKNRPVVTFR